MNWQKSGKDGGTGNGTAVTYRDGHLHTQLELALMMVNQTTRYYDAFPLIGPVHRLAVFMSLGWYLILGCAQMRVYS